MNLKDDKGRYLTQALFWEYRRDGITPVFTVDQKDKIKDRVVYLSLKALYMKCADPTEDSFVKAAFDGDWEHWRRIKNNDLLATKMNINEWPNELEVHLRSMGIRGMISIAEDKKHRSNSMAVKWLAEGGWKTRPAGRPSADEVQAEKKIAADLGEQFSHVSGLFGDQ